MDLTERFAWQGRQIAWGSSGAGPAVVFCHGTPFSSVLWQPFADGLSKRFTVYLWDMPGYGLSSKRAGHDVDFASQAQAFAALPEHWGLDRPHVVAHDFGGAVALRTHLVGGIDYASLMLCDVVAIPPSGSPFFQFVQSNPVLLDQLPGYIHRAILRAYISNASLTGLRDDVLDTLIQPWTGEEGQSAFYRQIVDYDERYLRENEDRLSLMTLPVRVVWADQDEWIPVDMAHRLTDSIPGATLGVVAGAGHLIHHDAAVGLMAELGAWLHAQT